MALTEVDFQKIKHSQALNRIHLRLLMSGFDVQLHMRCRVQQDKCRLKSESVIVRQDEKGQKYSMLSLNICTKTMKMAAQKQREPTGIHVWAARESALSCRFVGERALVAAVQSTGLLFPCRQTASMIYGLLPLEYYSIRRKLGDQIGRQNTKSACVLI